MPPGRLGSRKGRVGNLAASRSPCRRLHCAWDALACSAAAPSCCLACASSSVMREHTPSCRCRYGENCSMPLQWMLESSSGVQSAHPITPVTTCEALDSSLLIAATLISSWLQYQQGPATTQAVAAASREAQAHLLCQQLLRLAAPLCLSRAALGCPAGQGLPQLGTLRLHHLLPLKRLLLCSAHVIEQIRGDFIGCLG